MFAGGLALVIVGISGIWSYYGGAAAILATSGAQPIEKAQDPQLFNVVEELCLAGGIPMPAIYLIDDPALNAFATGRDPQHAAVVVTTGLRQTLNREELQGVLGHELSHVRHYDIRTMMLAATMAGLIVMANGVLWNWIRWGGIGGRSSRSSRDNDNGRMILIVVLFVVAILMAILAPIMAQIIQLAISRQREYMADAGSVELTRNPDGLINALKKLGSDDHDLATANAGTAHLFIVNPFHVMAHKLDWDSAFSTHPPISEPHRPVGGDEAVGIAATISQVSGAGNAPREGPAYMRHGFCPNCTSNLMIGVLSIIDHRLLVRSTPVKPRV